MAWRDQWEVQSDTRAGVSYTVSVNYDDEWACDCPSWRFKKVPRPDCRHILQKKLELTQKGARSNPASASPSVPEYSAGPREISFDE